MKLVDKTQVGFVIGLAVIGLTIANVVFDLIPNGSAYQAQVGQCNYFNALVQKDNNPCIGSPQLVKNYGWPFVASKHTQSDNEVIVRVRSVPINKIFNINISLNGLLCMTLAVAGYILYSRYVRSKLLGDDPDWPILASSDMFNESGLTQMSSGKIVGYDYVFLTNHQGRVMMNITLSSNTRLHMIATGTASISSLPLSTRIEGASLRKLELEGNYPEYFRTYCTPDKEQEFLQVMEPSTMALLADFCRAYQFEILNETLYIAQANDAKDSNDQTTLIEDSEVLLKKIGAKLDRLGKGSLDK